MKTYLTSIGVICILLTITMSGCINQSTVNETKIIDRDRDGYNDDIDDFPDDSELHHMFEVVSWSKTVYDTWTNHTLYGVSKNAKQVIINVDTSGSSVELQLFLREASSGRVNYLPTWKYYFMGMGQSPNEHVVDLRCSNFGEYVFDHLLIINPGGAFWVDITVSEAI